MKQEEIEPLRIEVTQRQHINAAAVAAITDPDVAAQFAKDVAQFAAFAQAHAQYAHCVAYDRKGFTPKPVFRKLHDGAHLRVDREVPDGIIAAAQRANDARLEAPAILSIENAVKATIKAKDEREAEAKDRAARHRQRDRDLAKIQAGEVRCV